jgi:trehalose 6-phosphate phosphatase
VQSRLRVPNIGYLGLYGWERTSAPTHPSSAIRHVMAFLAGVLPPHPGIWIEDKQHTIAVHYRNAPDALRPLVAERVHRAVSCWRSRLRVRPGKCVLEIVPSDIANKGVAVRRELAMLSAQAFPIYVGDDLSDESAFAVLHRGLSVRVGTQRRSRARYRVDSPTDVRQFLERLEAEFL